MNTPSALMGYAPPLKGASRACVRVCAWCPDKAAAEAEAEKYGHDVTHGICPKCFQKQQAALLGERED